MSVEMFLDWVSWSGKSYPKYGGTRPQAGFLGGRKGACWVSQAWFSTSWGHAFPTTMPFPEEWTVALKPWVKMSHSFLKCFDHVFFFFLAAGKVTVTHSHFSLTPALVTSVQHVSQDHKFILWVTDRGGCLPWTWASPVTWVRGHPYSKSDKVSQRLGKEQGLPTSGSPSVLSVH